MDQRLKRRLLSEAVEDNVRAIKNQPRGRLARGRPVPWAILSAVLALGVAAAALTISLRQAPPVPVVAAPVAAPVDVAALPSLAEGLPEPAGAAIVSAPPARVPGGVFPVAVRRVALDPGHGGGDQGTKTPSGLLEKELTLDIARRVAARLAAAGYEPLLTRNDDRRVALAERARAANDAGADLFVSIHVNWLEDGRANRGIETFFLGPSDDPAVNLLASAENLESGYAMADVRRLLDSIYADLRQEQSRALAGAVQRRLVTSIREVAPEVSDRGVKSAPFLVLVSTAMPAILAEVACLSNAEEARLLGSPEYRERIAAALFEGIAAYSRAVQRSESVAEGGKTVR